jgi:hypothetical protein
MIYKFFWIIIFIIIYVTTINIITYKINDDCLNQNIMINSAQTLIWEIIKWEKHYATTYIYKNIEHVHDISYHQKKITLKKYLIEYPNMYISNNIFYNTYTKIITFYLQIYNGK